MSKVMVKSTTDVALHMLHTPYQWQTNDCLSLIENVCGIERPDYCKNKTEKEARLYMRKTFGSETNGLLDYFNNHRKLGIRDPHLFSPGIIVMSNPDEDLVVGNNRFPKSAKRWSVGIVDESMNIITFTPVGFMPLYSIYPTGWKVVR